MATSYQHKTGDRELIQQAYITSWRHHAPWFDDAQVEQDLVLSRALVEIFQTPALSKSLALRGGTALNKLYIRPGNRYSEDIDLVQTEAGSAGPLIDGIRNKLDIWLGEPRRKQSKDGLTLTYNFMSEIAPIRALRLKIEINTREHFSTLGWKNIAMEVENKWFTGKATIRTYQLNELMGTKLRALYQRRKGRDLFDIWLCLDQKLINPKEVVGAFLQYTAFHGIAITRAQFEENLYSKSKENDFLSDIAPLIRHDITYDPNVALNLVNAELVSIIPGQPWQSAEQHLL